MTGLARQDGVSLDPVYRRSLWSRLRFDSENDLIYCPQAGTHILTRQQADYVASCRSFRSVLEHAEALRVRYGIPPENLEAVRGLLLKAIDCGLLVSVETLVDRLIASAAPEEDPGPITAVGFITKNRVNALRRALESYGSSLVGWERGPRLLVFDDSEACATRRQVRQSARVVARETGLTARYAGTEEKQTYCRRLREAANVTEEVLRFGLLGEYDVGLGITEGANRNCLLLETTGERIYCADDDTQCRMLRYPSENGSVIFSSKADPTEIWFYDDLLSAVEAQPFQNLDPLRPHESFLGRHVGSLLSDEAVPDFCVEGEPIAEALLRTASAEGGRIMATFVGLVGDAGVDSMRGLLGFSDEATWQRFTQSEDSYRKALEGRSILRLVGNSTVVRGGLCMNATVGLDNRHILPPFPPVLRGSDGVFGAILSRCFPHDFVAHLPYAICHLPVEARQNPGPGSSVPMYFCELLLAVIGSQPAPPFDMPPQRRLSALGEYLIDVAAMPRAQWDDYVLHLLMRAKAAQCEFFERLLATRTNAPEYWARDVQHLISELQGCLRKRDRPAPIDFPLGDRAQDLLKAYGNLLYCWPKLVGAAKRLKEDGFHIAEPVGTD